KPYYLQCSKVGFQFLRDVMWDKTYGGFYNLVDRKGNVKSNPRIPKDAYGNAFAIYALSAYYKASGDTGALDLVRKAFSWMEEHSHDPVYKGYYQHLQRDGTPVMRDASIPSTSDIGYKDQNSSIHILEALTELYHVSFGHDIETTYLMLEASHALGLKNDTLTKIIGKRMLDHALKNGWDNKIGGFYDEGYYFKGRDSITIIFDSKNWWAQAEGLNTLLLMADQYPDDPMHYYDKFKQQWNYIQTYIIDHVNGEWYEEGLDNEPQRKTALKGHIWKASYHNFRALANCVKRLRSGSEILKD